ncbi:hypothetical protein [Streptomyces sp. NPDC058953]|uniref:hypothetical protein n=1 Tax=unclassified Streptomyces TaxID=2593676 RepID=UPI00367B7697
MASRETTPDGGSAPSAPVRRAAAVAALAEEPTTGLFPAPAPSATPSAGPDPDSDSDSEPDGASSTAVATVSGRTAAPSSSAASSESAAAPVTPTPTSSTAPAASATASTTAAAPATGSRGGEPAETNASGAGAADGAARTRAGTMAAVRARFATATRTAGPGSGAGANSEGTPPGRPNKPLIAAAVLGGLVLVAVPFLISGSDEKPRKSAAGNASDGNPMNPDGVGPGLVPGEERLAVPGGAKGGTARPGAGAGGAGGVRFGNGPVPAAGLGPVAGPRDGGIAPPSGNGAAKPGGTTTPGKAPGTPTGKAAAKPEQKPPAAPGGKTPPKSNPAKQTPAAPPPAPPAAATYSHLIGLGCDTPGFATGDYYVDKNEGWLKHWGSTKSHGCNGLFYSLPMSGSSTSDGIWAQWKFTTGRVEKGLCSVEVFIPDVGDNDYVGGTPAHYTVYRAFAQKSSNRLGTFTINQPSRRGQWVPAGTYRISGGKISVVLDNRGSGADNRHAAAAPVRVDCTAS